MVVANQGRVASQEVAIEEQPKGGRWLWLEEFSLRENGNIPLDYVKKLAWKAGDKKHCPKRFDERDLNRFSRTKIQVYFMKPNISGQARPRYVERD